MQMSSRGTLGTNVLGARNVAIRDCDSGAEVKICL